MATPFVDRFSHASDQYRSARPHYPAELFAALAEQTPGRSLAWDCGTGNGQAAIALEQHFDHVHASDPSVQQIGQALPAERVTFVVEPAERTSLADGCADLVVAAQSLHWFNRDLFYAEAKRVLKPGGVLAAWGYDWMYVEPAVDAVINRALMPLLAAHWAPQNALLWAGYRSIDFPGEEIRLGAFAIYLDWSFEQVRSYVLSWSAVRALLAVGGQQRLDAALQALAAAWGPDSRRVVMPLFLRVARLS